MTNVKKANKEYDEYNTVTKIHTLTVAGQTQEAHEVKCGVIKINGTEQFSSYAEMVECLQGDVVIETKVL